MTTDNKPETQAEAEALAQEYIDAFCSSRPGTLNPMMGPRLVSLDPVKKTITMAFDAAEWMSNPVGMMHGGAICTATDIAMGVLTYTLSGMKMAPTVTQQVSFLRPIPLGEKIKVIARANSVGRTIASLTCELYLDSGADAGKLAATATAVFSTSGKPYTQWKFDKADH